MEMVPDLQVKLNRVLQERSLRHLGDTREFPIEVRVIAATNKPLVESLDSRAIRKDLYYRLSVITIHLPALRERAGDIPLLAEHFLKKHQKDFHKTMNGFEPRAMEAMMKYPWPGNVRELENLVEMMLAYGKSAVIRYSVLPERIVEIVPSPKKPSKMEEEGYKLEETQRILMLNTPAKKPRNQRL